MTGGGAGGEGAGDRPVLAPTASKVGISRRATQLGGAPIREAAITTVLGSSLLPVALGSGVPAASPLGPGRQVVDLPLPGAAGIGNIVGGFVGGQISDAVSGLLRALSADFLDKLAAPVAEYVLHTPDLLAEPSLRRFWLIALSALLACAGLLVAVAGLALTTGSQSRLGMLARESLGVRLPGCLLTAAMSLPVVALEVGLANRLVDAFVEDGFASGNNPLWQALGQAVHGDPVAGLALVVTTAVGVVLLVALVVLALARWATLWLLVVLAPLAMGFALLPGGAGVARLWWRLQIATVFLPVANAVLLGTYVAMFTSERSGLVGALSGVAVLALMTKLPAWVAGHAANVDAGELTGRLRRSTASPRRAVAQTLMPSRAPSRNQATPQWTPSPASRATPRPPVAPTAGPAPPPGSPAANP